jgi:hypothetical protein
VKRKIKLYAITHDILGDTFWDVFRKGLMDAAARYEVFDVAPLQTKSIQTGRILATIDSQQSLQGYLSVLWMWLYLNCGFTSSRDIYTGPVIVDTTNVTMAADGTARGFR